MRPERIPAREVGLVCVLACVLAVAMNWPVAMHLGSRIGEDLGDPVRTAWQLAWQGHAFLDGRSFYDANAFWPAQHSFAFSDSLLGYMPASLIGHGVHASLYRYNLLYLFAYALCFVGAYLLARELGIRRSAALVAGAVFAYAPFKLSMNGHLHVISSGGIPLSLFLLLRGYRRRRLWIVAAGWLVVVWQLTLGFTLGLQLAYLLAVLTAIWAGVWLRRGRPSLPRGLAVATVIGVVACAGVAALQARPLMRVADAYPEAHRAKSEISNYSAGPKAFLSAAPEDLIWGSATAPIRDTLRSPNEQNQFPGVAVALLAVGGLLAGTVLSRRLRIGLALGVCVVAVASLGLGFLNGDFGYRLLVDHAPGWDAVRTPGRLATLTSLGLALLAAAGAQRAIGGAAGAFTGRRGALAVAAPAVLTAAIAGAVLAEGRGSVPSPTVPPVPSGQDAELGPQYHLPTNAAYDRLYQYWSSNRFQPLANGVATFVIRSQDKLRAQMAHFPDARSVRALRRTGFRTVILHLDVERLPIPRKQIGPFPVSARRAAARSVAGLPLTRIFRGDYVVYRLKPLGGRRP